MSLKEEHLIRHLRNGSRGLETHGDQSILGSLDHTRRSTEHNFGVWRRCREFGSHNSLGDEALAVGPVLRRLVEHIPKLEVLRIIIRKCLEFLSQKNVLFAAVGED